LELSDKQITAATEEITKTMIQIVGVLNGVDVEPSDIDDETVIMLAEQIRVNALPAIEYAKARQADEQARRNEGKDEAIGGPER
jgi:hypothetical protein